MCIGVMYPSISTTEKGSLQDQNGIPKPGPVPQSPKDLQATLKNKSLPWRYFGLGMIILEESYIKATPAQVAYRFQSNTQSLSF